MSKAGTFREVRHEADFCVVGGGLAGLCAAVAAARHGVKTVLMHDRPMLGGNASSEVRMWVRGAHGKNLRETGLIEEICLENVYRNPRANYALWDSILYEKAAFQDNLTLLLNCTCLDAEMDGARLRSVRGWQLTTQTYHAVDAVLFADCSGDSVLAPLSGAEYRIGREACGEYDEPIEPERADDKTMGMSLLLQARETPSPKPFISPAWAHHYETEAEYNNRGAGLGTNFWWIEIGGEQDCIHDAEDCRDELLKIALGIWDFLKNRSPEKEKAVNWELDWMGFLVGKRESRRYLGDHLLTQREVEAGGRFDDLVAYGGWSMDDHFPAGIRHPGRPTIFHPAPSPYGIPYRTLYSRNVENLFCAGRNHSASHAAFSSTRVMATCAVMGQAAGTAAAVAVRHDLSPRGVYEEAIDELKQVLMEDDCYLPWNTRAVPPLTLTATPGASTGDPEPLRDGTDRPVGEDPHAWEGPLDAWIEYRFAEPAEVKEARFVFDSDLEPENLGSQRCNYPLDYDGATVPAGMVKDFRVEVLDENGGWGTAARVTGNYRRLVRLKLSAFTAGVRLVPESSWGSDRVRIYAFDVR